MKLILLTAILLIVTGCTTTESESEKWSVSNHHENYPYSELEAIYDAALSGMTDNYFKDFPELDREHTARLKEFIQESVPQGQFVSDMVRGENVDIFRKAKESKEYRDTKEFQDAFQITLSVSVSMARMMMGGVTDIYVAKYVDKDPIRIELFEIVEEDYQREFISWIYGEVSIEEARKELGDYEFIDGDRIYGFSSPPNSWENLCGREGFIVVRGDKIHDTIVTIMN
ncbi:hypothetical protein MLD52_21620 [Puniceicoccaceae bacterium K14]|nr:hypothetical protein [Puniceicoccaceae bacterium K14]